MMKAYIQYKQHGKTVFDDAYNHTDLLNGLELLNSTSYKVLMFYKGTHGSSLIFSVDF